MSGPVQQVQIRFASEETFREEYASNLANGGVFVQTDLVFEPRDPVRVEIFLSWCKKRISLGGEVVHCLTAALAPPGVAPGVAIHLDMPASQLRDKLAPLLGEHASLDERQSQTGERHTPRTPVRLRARLHTDSDGQVGGRMRDLSVGGALLSVDGEPPAIGESISLSIVHPTTGEEMELEGSVVRHQHIPNSDDVAVGVRFDLAEGLRREKAETFVESIRATEHARRLGGIAGSIAELGLENLIQMLGTCSSQGTLVVRYEAEEGCIAFEQGMLRSARCGDLSGQGALGRMLAWPDGSFDFQATLDPDVASEGGDVSLEAAIFDAMRVLDEDGRDGDSWDLGDDGASESRLAIDSDALLHVDLDAADAAGGDLSRTEEAIVELASVGMTVAKVIEVIPEPDDEIEAALLGLLAQGIVLTDS